MRPAYVVCLAHATKRENCKNVISGSDPSERSWKLLFWEFDPPNQVSVSPKYGLQTPCGCPWPAKTIFKKPKTMGRGTYVFGKIAFFWGSAGPSEKKFLQNRIYCVFQIALGERRKIEMRTMT